MKGNGMKIDLSLSNKALYERCDITEVGGRLTLTTTAEKAVEIVGRNIQQIVTQREPSILLTGPMAVWAYLVVAHHCMHRCDSLWYSDGRGEPLLIAAHGLIVKPE